MPVPSNAPDVAPHAPHIVQQSRKRGLFGPSRSMRGLASDPAANEAVHVTANSNADGASVLDQAADRDGSDVAGRRKCLGQVEADVDQ